MNDAQTVRRTLLHEVAVVNIVVLVTASDASPRSIIGGAYGGPNVASLGVYRPREGLIFPFFFLPRRHAGRWLGWPP